MQENKIVYIAIGIKQPQLSYLCGLELARFPSSKSWFKQTNS